MLHCYFYKQNNNNNLFTLVQFWKEFNARDISKSVTPLHTTFIVSQDNLWSLLLLNFWYTLILLNRFLTYFWSEISFLCLEERRGRRITTVPHFFSFSRSTSYLFSLSLSLSAYLVYFPLRVLSLYLFSSSSLPLSLSPYYLSNLHITTLQV